MINRLELYNKVLRDATAKGSAGNYYDLSIHDFKGNVTLRNTANSYLISAPGYYKIPLVYGNAIKNNATNESAYKTTNTGPNILQNFKDHNGNNIDNPWITLTNGGANAPDGAKIVWSDQSGIVELTSIGLEGTGDNAFVHFHVPQDKIKNGNAVIAVTKGGVVVWSWHLWFDHKEVLETIKCTNFDNIDYNFTKLPLGFAYRKWEGTTYDKPRMVRLKVEQEGAKMLSYINIRQDPGSVKNISSTIYQWGRKDALPGVETVSDGTFIKNGGEDMSFQNGIQHPEKFYQILNMYTALWEINPPAGYNYQNLWATDKAIVSINDHAKAKSIYDPCPVGFQVPAGDAFTWATTTGENASANANYNTIGFWNYGYYFNNKISNPDASIWFPDTGRRSYRTGNLESVSDGNMLHFSESNNWTNQVSNMYPSQCTSFYATFNFYNLSPKFSHRRSHGLSVRPITE